MNKFLKWCSLAMLVVGAVDVANAAPDKKDDIIPFLDVTRVSELKDAGYGTYLGTFAGNESNTDLDTIKNQIVKSDYFDGDKSLVLNLYTKVDVEDKDIVPVNTSLMTVTYNNDGMTGTWSTTPNLIDFYTVKGADYYSIWWMGTGAKSGFWTTEGLLTNGGKQPTISHLSTFNQHSENVPEPSVISLFGIGLLSIVGLVKRRKK